MVAVSPHASLSPLTGKENTAVQVRPHPQFPGKSVVQCVSTGVQYTEPTPTSKELTQLYDEQYNSSYGRDFNAPIPEFANRRAVAQRAFITEHIQGPLGKVAELGAGWGCLSHALAPLATSALCFELDSEAVKFMKSRGLDARFGLLEESPDVSDMDLIMSSHVLEHVPSPLETLRACYAALKPGGNIFTEIPLENPVPNWWGTDPADPYWVGHLTFFGRGHLETMLRTAGFEVVASTAHDHPVSAGYCMPGEAGYDVSVVPESADAEVSTEVHPRLERVLAVKPSA